MHSIAAARLERLERELARLRGDPALPPEASIVIPVNAQADLENALDVVGEVVSYNGRRTFEVILVINNYPAERPPPEIAAYEQAGVRVVAVPSVWRAGEAVCLSARIPGIRVASSNRVMLFDADCRIPNPSHLFDWYAEQFDRGAQVAYTHVGYYDLRPLWSVRARMVAHHLARWIKRVILRVPTTRGSNYATDRALFLRLYESGFLTDDLNVGPAAKAAGGRIVYSRARDLRVMTSGRKFRGGWLKLARYLRYRLLYNARVLPVQAQKRGRARNPYHHTRLR
jgi:hypothetical protein